MAARKKTPALPAIDRSHFVEDVARAGEMVRITGERGKYKILAEVLNTSTGMSWVELVGGANGTKQFRAVRPSQVRKVTK